jgi:protease I
MPHAVIITGPGFQDLDVIYTYYRLREALFDVDVATNEERSPGNGIHATGRYGVPVPLDKTAGEQIAFGEFAPGYEAPDRVRQKRVVKDLVWAMNNADEVVADLCHGPWIMISAHIMHNRRACAYVGVRDDMVHAGCERHQRRHRRRRQHRGLRVRVLLRGQRLHENRGVQEPRLIWFGERAASSRLVSCPRVQIGS